MNEMKSTTTPVPHPGVNAGAPCRKRTLLNPYPYLKALNKQTRDKIPHDFDLNLLYLLCHISLLLLSFVQI